MQTASSIFNPAANVQLSLKYLFVTFFKIGCVAFGGHMALVSLIQKVLVEQDKMLDDEVILDGVALASLLPGPLAVNVVAYAGYHLKGKSGALVSIVAILLPACFLMLCVAHFYFSYAYKIEWLQIMQFIGATVSVVILSTGIQLFNKGVSGNYKKVIICIGVVLVSVLTSSYLISIGLIFLGALMGLLMERRIDEYSKSLNNVCLRSFKLVKPGPTLLLSILFLNEMFFLSGAFRNFSSLSFRIMSVFSGISLSLFGGGYVMIPIMQTLFVQNLHWLNVQEFVDTIAFSQATPGPILVSATFIGYKLAGGIGALLATVAMFGPSAILMILIAKVFKKSKSHAVVKDMLSGIKTVVVGLILSSAIKLILQQPHTWPIAFIASLCLILNYKYKISPVYLILASISIGLLSSFYYASI